MDPCVYNDIYNYKRNGTYPDGYTRNEKTNFRRKANTFDVQGKTMLEHLLRTHGALPIRSFFGILMTNKKTKKTVNFSLFDF